MHPRIILAIIRKDATDIWINKSTLGGLLFPILMTLVYFFIGKLIGNANPSLLVYNPGNSDVTAVVAAAFANPIIDQASSETAVTAAFGENGAKKKTPYAAGIIVPADFETLLASGSTPQITLYFNGSSVNAQTRTLIAAAVVNYARARAAPQPPVILVTSVINPPVSSNAGVALREFYMPLTLLISLFIGTMFIPTLLIEEKEKKTLRMLMITPASFLDVLVAKLLVVLAYQLVLTFVVLAIQGAFTGQVGLVVLYAVLGGCLSMGIGLLLGAAFDSVTAASGVAGVVILVYVVAGIFIGPLGEILGNSPVRYIIKLIPTYYIADGVYNAITSAGTVGSNLLDLGVIIGCTIILIAVSSWILRRKSSVTGAI
jgi:ABC-2 type transport system permease protein